MIKRKMTCPGPSACKRQIWGLPPSSETDSSAPVHGRPGPAAPVKVVVQSCPCPPPEPALRNPAAMSGHCGSPRRGLFVGACGASTSCQALNTEKSISTVLSEGWSSCSLGFGPCEGAFPDLQLQLMASSGEDSLL